MLRRQRERSKEIEDDLPEPSADYLRELNEAYQHFFFHYNATPLLVVETSHFEVGGNDAALDDLMPWWLRIDWRWWTLRAAAPLAALLLLAGGAATWTAASSSDTGGSSVTSALVDTSSSVSNDSLLLAVLSGSPDDAVSRYEGGIE